MFFDGENWIPIITQTVTTGGWNNPNHLLFDVSAYANSNFQVRFHYFDNYVWAWYWAIDNFEITNETNLAPRAIQQYNIFLDDQFITQTVDTTYQLGSNGENLVPGETYLVEVSAVYTTGESERKSKLWEYQEYDPMQLVFNTGLSEGTTITLPLMGAVDVTVDWGDGTQQSINSAGLLDHTYETEGIYTVSIYGTLSQFGNSYEGYAHARKLTHV